MKTINIRATECDTRDDAIRHAREFGGRAVLLNARPMVVSDETALRLETARAAFAFLTRHAATGLVMTVPVN
jgi:hypothetical protein